MNGKHPSDVAAERWMEHGHSPMLRDGWTSDDAAELAMFIRDAYFKSEEERDKEISRLKAERNALQSLLANATGNPLKMEVIE